jgi:hypothetical protein
MTGDKMKTNYFLTTLFLGTAAICSAKDYYVSKQGHDEAAGTKEAPFATIQRAASGMRPGDECLIASGTYAETIEVKQSGTAEDPIVFRPANEAAQVVLTGADPISENRWERIGEHLFKCKINLPLDSGNQIFLNEQSLTEARWPNCGDDLLKPTMAVMDGGTTPEHILDADLPDYDFTGGRVWVHAPLYWQNWDTEIQGHERHSLQIKNRAPFPGKNQHVARKGAGFFVYGIRDALDADNEWYYDAGRQELTLFRSDGKLPRQPYWVKKRPHILNVSGRQHLQFHGLTIMGSGILTDQKTEQVLFDQLKLFYPLHDSRGKILKSQGFILNGKNNTVQNSEIAYSSGPCIVLNGENNKLLNSYIHDGNLFGSFTGCVFLKGKGNVISHCTMKRSGRTLINYAGMYQALIQHCDLSDAGMLTSDLGLTYGTNIEGGNSEVRYNLMHDNHGEDKTKNMGLYYDHGTKNVITHHNIVWGAGFSGLLINHYANGHLVYNNTFIGGTYGFRSAWGNKYEPDLLNCRFVNNLFGGAFTTTATNYFATHNEIDYQGFEPQHPMKGYSEGYGKGLFIEGISRVAPAGQPGIGAIEYDGMTFKAGHDFEHPPVYDFTRCLPAHRNLLKNAAFEHEDGFYPWQGKDSGVTPVKHAIQNHAKDDVNLGRMGSYSAELTRKGSALSQRVSGLEPGRTYAFISELRVANGEAAVNGVRFSDGTELLSGPITAGAPGWTRCRLNFIAPEEAASVEVFVRRLSGGEGKTVHADDLSLTLQ